jgi:acetyl esterase/lipase
MVLPFVIALSVFQVRDGFAEDAGIRVIRDVAYLGEDRSEKMDLYLPTGKSETPRPAILIVHGGGWHGGDKAARRENNIGKNLASAGYVCASINYRLCKKTDKLAERLREVWPANLQDCRTAVRFLRMKAETYGIDPDHIGAIGGSAGGHLTAMLAVTNGEDDIKTAGPHVKFSSRIQAVVPMYGVHDVVAQARAKNNLLDGSDEELCQQASPVTWVTRDDPPALILHGTEDPLVPVSQSEILHERLTKVGVPSQLVIIDGAPHSFHLQPKQRDLRPIVVKFFDRHLRVAQSKRGSQPTEP